MKSDLFALVRAGGWMEDWNMNGRLALKSALAFCLALGLGRLLLPEAQASKASRQAAWGTSSRLPMVNVSAPANALLAPSARAHNAPEPQPIVRELKAVPGGVANENARFSHFFSNLYTEGSLIKAARQFGATVQWTPQAQELYRDQETVAAVQAVPARARVEQGSGCNQVVFPGTYPDTDERMYVRRDGGVEHDIILKRAVPGTNEHHGVGYSGHLQLSPGLTLWDGGQQIQGHYSTRKGVHIKNQFGNTVFYLRPPVAWDASVSTPDGKSMDTELQSVKPRAATACEYRFDFDASGVKLAVVTPGRWLADPARAYPVTIDPNMGEYGLADGDPPTYAGTNGTDTLMPANAGGSQVKMTVFCPGFNNLGMGSIPVPFPFTYYGQVHPPDSLLWVHISGFASWDGDPKVAALDLCNDSNNVPLPTLAYPMNAYFPYWSDLRISSVQGAGIYWFSDGTAPNRRLVIEWYKMGFANGSGNQYISFNLVLYECDNKIEFIIGESGDVDLGFASVGIVDPTGAIGIQYDFNSANGGLPTNNVANPFNNLNNGNQIFNPLDPFGNQGNNPFANNQNNPPVNNNNNNNNGQITTISPGTSLVFQRSALGFVVSTPTGPLNGCIPHAVCWATQVAPPVSACNGGQSQPTAFGYQWTFGDNSQGFTGNICHTWVKAGTYTVTLVVTDDLGNSSNKQFTVQVCDVPDVVVSANPQGGAVPLVTTLSAQAASPTTQLGATPSWSIDRLGAQNNPGQAVSMPAPVGNPVNVEFDVPGLYRVSAVFSGQDSASGLSTTGVGTVYVFAVASAQTIQNSLVITDSKFKIDFVGKHPVVSSSAIPAVSGGNPSNPVNDTLTVTGFVNLPGSQLSDLTGKYVQVVLNGTETILDATFGADGKAVQLPQDTGETGQFQISLPSGAFSFNVKRDLCGTLGLADGSETLLLPAMFGLQIENLYPPPGTPGALITYGYRAHGYNAGPPPIGFGNGTFHFGASAGHNPDPSAPADFGKVGGNEQLLSGAFMVVSAKLKFQGNSVSAILKGKLTPFGGDGLQPQDNSDVIVSLGGWSEALNFSTTVGFKARGNSPAQSFSFKRPKTMGKTGVAALQWTNQAGDFSITTNALPNELVGLNPSLGVQTITAGLTITPNGGSQVFAGTSTLTVIKTSATNFVK
ncbi:MAG: PKD domain-containing protein [Planctomycetota bacterium]